MHTHVAIEATDPHVACSKRDARYHIIITITLNKGLVASQKIKKGSIDVVKELRPNLRHTVQLLTQLK